MKETNRIELKQELHPEVDIEKEVISFLNYKEGGIIYIGINKHGEADRIEITSAMFID
jgi:predicted HTH transcriptional regulator